MENQDILKAIATLADKVSKTHSRMLALERDNTRLQKTLDEHFQACSCHSASKSDTQVMVSGLDSEVECEACGA